MSKPKTTWIRNARIVDGSSAPAYRGELLLEGDRIVAAGTSVASQNPDRTVDAEGCVVAPGFIDPHTHSDLSIFAAPEATGKISQGVTTDVVGNCGLSAFPINDLNREHLRSVYRNYPVEIKWNTFADYAATMERAKPSVNIAALCGHNTLRAAVRGYAPGIAAESECDEMARLLRECLSSGAAGLSFGLLYVPGKFSDSAEQMALVREIGRAGAPFAIHLRSEGRELLESVRDAIGLLRVAGSEGALHISHLKTSGSENWHKIDELIAFLSCARRNGLRITADRYPYVESMTQLSIVVPEPFDAMSDTELERHIAEPSGFDAFLGALAALPKARWNRVRLVQTRHPGYRRFAGMKWAEIVQATRKEPERICAEILKEDISGAMAAFAGMSPANLDRILALPYVCCGSDESARPVDERIGLSHPRGFGAFPRFFQTLRRLGISVEETIARMTSLPAAVFGLRGRGRIAPGYAADLVLFDPEQYRDCATFEKPHRICEGIRTVWVNGEIAWSDGRAGPRQTGRFLKCVSS
jgi:N-acyl-D-amino-acid deacylase